MCRKLTLTGWVLVVASEDAVQARVVMALFVSITFFGLNLRFKPLRRCAKSLNGPRDAHQAHHPSVALSFTCPPRDDAASGWTTAR
eukprot:6933362-Prymnesium_polylepis.1